MQNQLVQSNHYPVHTQVHCNPEWIALQQQLGCTVLLGTRSMGDLHVLSTPTPDSVNFHVVKFPLCMGMAVQGNHLAVACKSDIRLYYDLLAHPQVSSPVYQRSYSPRSIHFTGDLDTHELDFDRHGHPLFVAARYSCIAEVSPVHSFKPVWQPKFIKRLTPEDCCHLNGLCMDQGELKYASMFAATAEPGGWRTMPFNSGQVWSTDDQEPVCTGLVQPHSPRLYRSELYVLNSGAGEIGRIDLNSGHYDCIAFVGGYGRGLSFIGDYAIFGISKPRHDGYVTNFPLHDRLKALHLPDRCQLIAVNLKTGHVIQAITFEGAAREFFDTVVIPDCRNGVIMNLDEAQHPQLVTCEQHDCAMPA
ncbi:TIGR03032 family protein [Limnobacter sp.]|uniref:TIGR03032 family protein n=1 Tax=Limnobacter sp. TaxID=2003368 RepID=UPI00311E2F6B